MSHTSLELRRVRNRDPFHRCTAERHSRRLPWRDLRPENARAKYTAMVPVHGGGRSVEKITAQWADRNAVRQVIFKPDWDRLGRAAQFRHNDDLLKLLPKGVIAFSRSGITDTLVDKAIMLGIPVQHCAA